MYQKTTKAKYSEKRKNFGNIQQLNQKESNYDKITWTILMRKQNINSVN